MRLRRFAATRKGTAATLPSFMRACAPIHDDWWVARALRIQLVGMSRPSSEP
jgi:hypothetical protein